MAKFLPIIGEIYTTVESAVLVTSAGLAKVIGDDKAADELLESSGKAWKEYSETNCIATPINGLIQESKGNYQESERLKKSYLNAASSVVDGVPVVGHVKGIVHYAMGDKEKGNRSMEASTRTAAVLGAGVLTGGLGGGLVAGATAGVGSGVAYDATVTVIDKVENGDDAKLHGTMALANANKMNDNEVVGAMLGIVGDGMTGASGAQLGKNIRTRMSGQKQLQNTFEDARRQGRTNIESAKATEITMDAAEASRKAQSGLKKQTGYATSEVMDLTTDKKGVGHSGNYYKEMRKQTFDNLGQESGYSSRNAAARANNYGEPSALQREYSNVRQAIPERPQACCAEHPAHTNLAEMNGNKIPQNRATATVYKKPNGVTNTAVRCDNCVQFPMGEVVTDCIPDRTTVPTSGYITDGYIGTASGAALYGRLARNADHY